MKHADKTVTVYKKRWDPEKGLDVYEGTVFTNVSFFCSIGTAISTEGLTAEAEGTLRIPEERLPEGCQLQVGDLICEGSHQTVGMQPSDMDKICPYVFTVAEVTVNTYGRTPHIKAVCK